MSRLFAGGNVCSSSRERIAVLRCIGRFFAQLSERSKTAHAARAPAPIVAWMASAILWVVAMSANAGVIYVTDGGAPSGSTCTLAQAIAAANAANSVDAASIGSATTNLGVCPAFLPAAGANVIAVIPASITLSTIDNYWYGPNALPPIASDITILAYGRASLLVASHVGDPTPATADAFRFFYVSGGLTGELPLGSLTLIHITLQGGYAKGGDADAGGGGGAGMGGAIFNQGKLSLVGVSLVGNTAHGGVGGINAVNGAGGGGMGQDGGLENGGGFGGSLGVSITYGGSGANGSILGGGGGGGGFVTGSNGGGSISTGHGGAGGGNGGLGGVGGPLTGNAAGDGGGGGNGTFPSANGGNFGSGGAGVPAGIDAGAGGGGAGGGGGGCVYLTGTVSNYGGGGGFGGGGGAGTLAGGYGGFGGGAGNGAFGGFGGGDDSGFATGGAGMGGAIFNHTGTVSLLNVTATNNNAYGGGGHRSTGSGSGLGAALFNLNGTVTIDFSTLAGNTLGGNNALLTSRGPEDGTVYSLAYGNKIETGNASTASLTIHNSIIHGTQSDSILNSSDVSLNVVNDAHTNTSTFTYSGVVFIGQAHTNGTVVANGSLNTADPLLGALSFYRASPNLLPVLPIGSNSQAYNAALSCLPSVGATPLDIDERGAARPYPTVGGQCDVGAYEFDGDYIFADGFGPRL